MIFCSSKKKNFLAAKRQARQKRVNVNIIFGKPKKRETGKRTPKLNPKLCLDGFGIVFGMVWDGMCMVLELFFNGFRIVVLGWCSSSLYTVLGVTCDGFGILLVMV